MLPSYNQKFHQRTSGTQRRRSSTIADLEDQSARAIAQAAEVPFGVRAEITQGDSQPDANDNNIEPMDAADQTSAQPAEAGSEEQYTEETRPRWTNETDVTRPYASDPGPGTAEWRFAAPMEEAANHTNLSDRSVDGGVTLPDDEYEFVNESDVKEAVAEESRSWCTSS